MNIFILIAIAYIIIYFLRTSKNEKNLQAHIAGAYKLNKHDIFCLSTDFMNNGGFFKCKTMRTKYRSSDKNRARAIVFGTLRDKLDGDINKAREIYSHAIYSSSVEKAIELVETAFTDHDRTEDAVASVLDVVLRSDKEW